MVSEEAAVSEEVVAEEVVALEAAVEDSAVEDSVSSTPSGLLVMLAVLLSAVLSAALPTVSLEVPLMSAHAFSVAHGDAGMRLVRRFLNPRFPSR